MYESVPAACSFCEISNDRGGASVAASDELTVAFMDAYPVAPGHVLIVPRRHVPSLDDLSPDEGAALWSMTQLMARRVKAKHAPAVICTCPMVQRPSRILRTYTCTLFHGKTMMRL